MFFQSKPICGRKFSSLTDVQDKMQMFNLMYELDPNTGSVNNCNDPNKAANWRKAIRNGAVRCQDREVEIDFFEKVAGGVTMDIDATDLYIKSLCDVDYNITAERAILANGPGQPVQFLLARSAHSAFGKGANVNEGGSILITRDEQWVHVTAVDRTTDYGWLVTVSPDRGDYQIRIGQGEKMLFSSVRQIGSTSCGVPANTWMTDGHVGKVQGLRMRKDFKFPIALDRPYSEVVQFGILFDRNGKEIPGWQYKELIDMRYEIKMRQNLEAFIGQRTTNQTLLTNGTVDPRFPGFDGYIPSVRYGGGTQWGYGKSQGFSLESDFTPIMLKQDAQKRSTEFTVLAGLPFMLNFDRRNKEILKNAAGSCTFETFKRMGVPDENMRTSLAQMGVNSYHYGGFSLHFKQMSALSDTRFIGNHHIPYMGLMMPSDGLTDSTGRDVPAIEFFDPKGWAEYREKVMDLRDFPGGCEYVEGHIITHMMMAVHCPHRHMILDPKDF